MQRREEAKVVRISVRLHLLLPFTIDLDVTPVGLSHVILRHDIHLAGIIKSKQALASIQQNAIIIAHSLGLACFLLFFIPCLG